VRNMNNIYKERRDSLLAGLKELGLDVKPPKATFYVWAHVFGKAADFSKMLLEKAGIVATPVLGSENMVKGMYDSPDAIGGQDQ